MGTYTTPNGKKVQLSPAMEDFLTGNRVRNAKATARALVARGMVNRRVWTLTEAGEQVAAQITADRIAAADEPGPFGVFEDGMCVEVADTRPEAEGYADQYRAADDTTDVTVEPLCSDHRDAEQPRNGCEECLTDDEADDDTEAPVHLRNLGGTLCGETGEDTAGTGHVTCEGCRELLADEADRHARGVFLCSVWEVPTDECDCSDCEALHADEDDAEEPPVQGRVIAHAGGTLGCDPEHADNPNVRAAITALTNAGHTPVTVTGGFDPEPGDNTTGFYVEPRHIGTPDECVYVHDVLNGFRTWKRDTDSKLNAYGRALYAAGWSIPTGHSRAVPALPPIEPAPAPLPKRVPGTRVRDAITCHKTPTTPAKPRAHRIPVKPVETPTGRTYKAACNDCDHTVGPYDIRAIAEERAGMHRATTARATA